LEILELLPLVEMRWTENIGDKESPHGIRGKVKNKKNKIIEPFKTCEFELIFNQGLNPYYGIIAPLERDGIVERNGAWYTVKETGKKFQSPSLQTLIESGDEGMLPIINLLNE